MRPVCSPMYYVLHSIYVRERLGGKGVCESASACECVRV